MDDNLGFEIVKALDCNDMGAGNGILTSVKQEETDEAILSNPEADLEDILQQFVKKTRREYPAGRFLKKELDYIAETYCNNYATFYHSTVNGGKDKDAIAKKKSLLMEMAEHISTLGEEQRTPEQVEQKIRDELKRVKKYMAAKKNGGSLPGKSKREIVLSSSQQMIADVVERTVLEPSRPKPVEQNGVDDSVVAVDTSFMEVPTAGSSLEVSPPASGHRNASPLHLRKKKRRLSSLREFDDRRQEFDFVREKRRGLEDDMKYARAKLEAVTAERDFWMAKIDVLDLERQFWMREIEKSLNDHY